MKTLREEIKDAIADQLLAGELRAGEWVYTKFYGKARLGEIIDVPTYGKLKIVDSYNDVDGKLGVELRRPNTLELMEESIDDIGKHGGLYGPEGVR